MSKYYLLLISILVNVVIILSLPSMIYAASNGKVGVTSVDLMIPNNYFKGISVTFILSGKDINNKDFVYKKTVVNSTNSACGWGPGASVCIDGSHAWTPNGVVVPNGNEMPNGNSDDGKSPPSLSGTMTYALDAEVKHLSSNNQIDTTGIIVCKNNCPPWNSLRFNQTIQGPLYEWIPPTYEISIEVPKTSITKSDQLNVRLRGLISKYNYVVGLEENSTKSNIYKKYSSFTINDQGNLQFTLSNELNLTTESANPPSGETTAKFTIKGADLPKENQTYNIKLQKLEKDGTATIRDTKTQPIYLTSSLSPQNDFLTTIIPSSINANTDQQVSIRVFQATPGNKYNFHIQTSNYPIDIKDVTAGGDTFDTVFNTKEGSQFRFTGPGNFPINVSKQGTIEQSQAFLSVTTSPVPTGPISPTTGTGVGTTGPGGAGEKCDPEAGTGKAGTGIQTAIGCIPTEPTQFILAVSRLATGMGGGIALLLIITGAFRMITSAGNPDSVKAGSEQITSAIIGLLFIIFAVLLLKVIGVDILDLPGFISSP